MNRIFYYLTTYKNEFRVVAFEKMQIRNQMFARALYFHDYFQFFIKTSRIKLNEYSYGSELGKVFDLPARVFDEKLCYIQPFGDTYRITNEDSKGLYHNDLYRNCCLKAGLKKWLGMTRELNNRLSFNLEILLASPAPPHAI